MRLRNSLFFALTLIVALTVQTLAFAQSQTANGARLEGIVTDATGASVIAAEVTLISGSFTATQKTDAEGKFAFVSVPASGGKITVRASGFASKTLAWSATTTTLEITLEPDLISEQVTVTAARTETRVSDTAASVVVLSNETLRATAALTVDDALRQATGFTLFRRSGSRTANPTIQGVSLRGVGASGASRAVVLADGIPLNDPFGGWVYWGRVPRTSLNRVEIVRGGASNLYGTDGLGGAVNLITKDTRELDFALEASYGNQQTPDLSVYGGGSFGQLGFRLSGETFHTDGYTLVDKDDRGRVDTPAGSEYSALDVTIERLFSDNGRIFFNGSYFGESRANGTPLQQNRTHIRGLTFGLDKESARAGAFLFRLFGSSQVFDQDFSAIAADRNSETLTRSQRVPAQQKGLAFQWTRTAGSRQTVVAGLDAREVRGASDELGFFGGNLTSAVGSGGRESIIGVFGQDIIRFSDRWLATIGGRVDHWRNTDALSTFRPLAVPGAVNVTEFRDRTETAFSPRVSLLHKLTDTVTLSAVGYRAFRAPTLNELYRAFRVGNVNTLANADLRAERLTGGEVGASLAIFNRKLQVRGAFFHNEVTRTVANVTLSVTPDLITRRRQNLGRTRSRGFEIEADARFNTYWEITGGYQFADAIVREFPANTFLEGLWIPQVARHQMTFQVRYANPSYLTLGIQGRAIGKQFDDDRNDFKLDPFFTMDAMAARKLTNNLEAFVAVENLFNERYDIGRTPVRTIGPPTFVRAGIRISLGAK